MGNKPADRQSQVAMQHRHQSLVLSHISYTYVRYFTMKTANNAFLYAPRQPCLMLKFILLYLQYL